MRIVHEPAGEANPTGDSRVLADHVEVADSLPSQFMGLRFRDGLPADHALVIEAPDSPLPLTGSPSRATVDMIGVGFPIDVLWLAEREVTQTKRLRPWIGMGIAPADTIVELPAGTTEDVAVGDVVRVEDGD